MTQTSGSAAGSKRRGGGGCSAQDVLVSIHRTDPRQQIMSCLSIQACHKLTQVPVRMTRDQADIYQVQSALAAASNSTRMSETLVKLGRCSRTRSPGKSLLLSTPRESMATHNCLFMALQGTFWGGVSKVPRLLVFQVLLLIPHIFGVSKLLGIADFEFC